MGGGRGVLGSVALPPWPRACSPRLCPPPYLAAPCPYILPLFPVPISCPCATPRADHILAPHSVCSDPKCSHALCSVPRPHSIPTPWLRPIPVPIANPTALCSAIPIPVPTSSPCALFPPDPMASSHSCPHLHPYCRPHILVPIPVPVHIFVPIAAPTDVPTADPINDPIMTPLMPPRSHTLQQPVSSWNAARCN